MRSSSEIHPKYIRSRVPEGRSGDWVVEQFDMPDSGAGSLDPRPLWPRTEPGCYTRLRHGSTVMMTDTCEEWWTQEEAIMQACSRGGGILISGLGLGLVVRSMLETPGSLVQHVTVIELSTDVVRLVAPHLIRLYGRKLSIVQADTFKWFPENGVRYTVGWHDIWPNPYDEQIRGEMDQLEQRYGPYCDWQGCWARNPELRK